MTIDRRRALIAHPVRTLATGASLVVIAGVLGAVSPAAAGGSAHPQIPVGGFPTGITLDPLTDTLYVANGMTNTLSLIDGRTCNAADVAGCDRRRSAVTAGVDPIGSAVDESTRTLYVANSSGTVAVVNDRRCDTDDVSGCDVEPATVKVGSEPQFVAVDQKTDTIYVANVGSNTVSVIDGQTCNSSVRSGCGHLRASVDAGPGPFALAIDQETNTIYVADLLARTVSVIDGRQCDAADTRGCARRPAMVEVGSSPGGIALDARTNTVYVTGQTSDEVWVIDGRDCDAENRTGCSRAPARVRAGAGARGIVVDESTDTIYVANSFANSVSVIDGASCNAVVRTGCGQHPAAAPVGTSPRRLAVDARTDTIYVTNALSDTVTMLDGHTCNGRVHVGCANEAPHSAAGGLPAA